MSFHCTVGSRIDPLHPQLAVLVEEEGAPADPDSGDEAVSLDELAAIRNRSPIFSAHQLGTCRMGSGPRSAVCDENGQVFGVRGLYIGDASAFPASSGVNPMITIMALAHHTAQRIKASPPEPR
jgi:choline dehydrogenase-like flavoprotein